MKRITMLAVFVAIALLTCVSGCQFLLEQKPGTGGVTFSLDLSAKTIQPPDASITIAKYAVSGTGPSGAVLSETLYTGSSFTISNLVAGAWTITISGRNAAGTEIGSGTVNLTIVSGNTVTTNVTLAPLTGEGVTGSFTFSASWTSPLVVTGISGTITASGGVAEPFTASISGSTASYSVPTLAAGSYLLSLTATESGGEKFKAIYALRVYKGLTSPLTIAFTMADFLGTTLPTYTVNYIGDSNTGGTVPVDENVYLEGASVTVLGNTGSLEKTDYKFEGWNTELGGTGTSYAPGATLTMDAGDFELYAKWRYSKKHAVQGILEGDDLLWTKANSPYQVEGHILVRSGKTLTIEPGVEVRFNGDYYIRIDGCIMARGTSDENISFIMSPDYTLPTETPEIALSQAGVKVTTTSVGLTMDGFNYKSGNIFEYCKFNDYPSIYDNGNALIKNCIIDWNTSTMYGTQIVIYNKYIISCDINKDTYINITTFYNSTISNNSNCTIQNSEIYNSKFYNCDILNINGTMSNSTIENISNYLNIGYNIYNCTFNNINRISNWGNLRFESCIFNLIKNTIYPDLNYLIYNSNIHTIESKEWIHSPGSASSSNNKLNYKGNYWGENNTEELNTLDSKLNTSFIFDFYDDFNLYEIDYSDWLSEPWGEGVGDCGDSAVLFNPSLLNGYPGSSMFSLTMIMNTSRPLSRIRWGYTTTELLAASWIPYYSGMTIYLDTTKRDEMYRYTTIWQGEDTEGNRSGAKTSIIMGY